MRIDVHQTVYEWGEALSGKPTDNDLKALERELIIVMTTPDPMERDQRVIDRVIGQLQKQLDTEPYPDAVHRMNLVLDESRIPYVLQKVIQNVAARIYRQGLLEGRRDPS